MTSPHSRTTEHRTVRSSATSGNDKRLLPPLNAPGPGNKAVADVLVLEPLTAEVRPQAAARNGKPAVW